MQSRTPPILVCTVGKPCLQVLEASVRAYAPQSDLRVHNNPPSSFGEAYNAAMHEAFERCDEVLIANDDAVLTPDTMRLLLEDVAALRGSFGGKVGLVAATADNVRWYQRGPIPEYLLAERVSPVFAWVSKRAFEAAQFPPINWCSDDVLCEDLNALGFQHAMSRAYVHHVGSQTIGNDVQGAVNAAAPWLRENRLAYFNTWFPWEHPG